MKWSEAKPDITIKKYSDILREMPLDRGLEIISKPHAGLILCETKCWADMINHITPHRVEMGGLLIGCTYHSEINESFITKCNRAIPAKNHDSSPVSLRMDADVWADANAQLAEKELVVGWYHSHPNLGAFFSGTDRYNQKANFNSFFHVGVVIDPVRDEKAAFTGQDSTEVRNDCFIVGSF